MKSTWIIWLLCGALAASLHWNWRHAQSAPLELPEPSLRADTHRCAIVLEELDLSEEQAQRLDQLCRPACDGAGDLAARAEEKLALLRSALAAERPDRAALDALVREISELRERSLGACVQSILDVRAVLDREQLAKLVETCAAGGSCAAGAEGGASTSTE
jgi:Spy/CpxP family protein refolding chaperone